MNLDAWNPEPKFNVHVFYLPSIYHVSRIYPHRTLIFLCESMCACLYLCDTDEHMYTCM